MPAYSPGAALGATTTPTNGDALIADSTATGGVKWEAPGAASLTDHTHAATGGGATGGGATLEPGTIILPNSAAPTPTTEGDLEWDNDNHWLMVGTGGATVTFMPVGPTVPVNQAFGDTAHQGTGGQGSRQDHVHGMPALGTTTAAIGTAAGGSAVTPSKSDHVHATGAGTPSTQAFGDAAATGAGPAAAMTDHKHAMPAGAPTTFVRKASDEARSLQAFADSAGLSFSVVAGTYIFEFVVFFQTNAATVGIKLAVNGPAFTAGTLIYGAYNPASAPSGAGSAIAHGAAVAYDTETIAITAGPGAVNTMAVLNGSVVLTASGTFVLRHGSETASSTTIKAGSWGRLTKIA